MLYVCVCVVSMYVCKNERICTHWRVQISSKDCCGALLHSTSMRNVKRGEKEGGVEHENAHNAPMHNTHTHANACIHTHTRMHTHTQIQIRTNIVLARNAAQAEGGKGRARVSPQHIWHNIHTRTHACIHTHTHTYYTSTQSGAGRSGSGTTLHGTSHTHTNACMHTHTYTHILY
jgi:hypothetical protein